MDLDLAPTTDDSMIVWTDGKALDKEINAWILHHRTHTIFLAAGQCAKAAQMSSHSYLICTTSLQSQSSCCLQKAQGPGPHHL